MAKPVAKFPTLPLPAYQEIGTVQDTNATLAQATTVALTSGYAAGATAVNIAVTGTPFATWPSYGFVQNLTTLEIMFYNNITGSNTLVVPAIGRGLSGSPTTIGAIGQLLNLIEARICGLMINQLFAEVSALSLIRTQQDITVTPRTILASESFQTFTNIGAGSEMIMNLPAAAAGLRYRFYVDNANGIRVVPNGTDTINEGDIATTPTTGYMEYLQAFATIDIQCPKAGVWVVTAKSGAWNLI